ncbi:L-serine ammonia-lyase [Bifidobacterium cuniculi]|uniref:L-serine dehydratase n=1 Tax=Bifidobacterium cuniculi TaxID=1688 RepID=A0A087B452_9BIFI|nr:L-serine ammonia-lyase [Bifidobacterium cuniculi]KFI65802.1 L-serine ammonia-lyase [Bifidobacterium cuniculi]
MFSLLDLFSIGVGPSSSHTVGPMLATRAFAHDLAVRGVLGEVAQVNVVLYGSLAMTGLGHGTDRAAVAGLEGNDPRTVDTDYLAHIHAICAQRRTIALDGTHRIAFDFDRDIVVDAWHRLAPHPNGLRCIARDTRGAVLLEQVWYSVGGGFIEQGSPDDTVLDLHDRAPYDGTPRHAELHGPDESTQGWPYPFATAAQLVGQCETHHISIADIVWANETASRPASEVLAQLDAIREAMHACVCAGCTSGQTVLLGGLDVPRRAPGIYASLRMGADVLAAERCGPLSAITHADAAWLDLFALAVSEENAAGGRVVTAPTNGSAGVIPSVLMFYRHLVPNADDQGVRTFLLTAAAVGYLIKRNASISGAEVGCQGEVGSACSMAAAGLCAVVGGTVRQVENAAEIGMEHHLGLTCDPVGGLVQIPCIERNAVAANTAVAAVRLAMLGDGSHIVSLDQVIATMRDTGRDMMSKYKETSQGGLALNVVEC